MKNLHGNLRGPLAVLFWHVQETVLVENNHNKVVLSDIFLNLFSLIEHRRNIEEACCRIATAGSKQKSVLTKYFLLHLPVSKSFVIYQLLTLSSGKTAVKFTMN